MNGSKQGLPLFFFAFRQVGSRGCSDYQFYPPLLQGTECSHSGTPTPIATCICELYCVQDALSYLSIQCDTCDKIEVKGNGQRKQASGGEINKK